MVTVRAETGCVFSGLDKDLLRALAKATVMVLLNEPEDTKLTAEMHVRRGAASSLSHEL